MRIAGRATLVAAVVIYASLLRLDAINQAYGPAASTSWLRHLHPAALQWHPEPLYPHRDAPPSRYRSDPYTYLQRAREMRWFYAASLREPLYPFAVRMWLLVLGNRDVAVSFASAAFSVLAVLATFLLGLEAFSFGVGLAAAFLLAIEYDVIAWSVQGWRDDAFTCMLLVTAWTLLRSIDKPTRGAAIAFGAACGLACLVRITSLSFVLPAFAYLLLAPRTSWLERRKAAKWAAIVGILLVAPYLIDCWRVYGDPLYAINAHADVYRATEGQDVTASRTAREYIGEQMRARPLRTVETFVLGVTRYPFANKWTGFEPWVTGAGRWIARAALVGLVLWIAVPEGRVLLVLLGFSLVPYAVTWRLISDWRFTEHAYPFFLLAACVTAWTLTLLAVPGRLRALAGRRPSPRGAVALVSCAVLIGASYVIVTRVLPRYTFREALDAGDPATIMPGELDTSFFAAGWDEPIRQATVSTRRAMVTRPVVLVPLSRAGEYDALFRVDSGVVDILVNGTLVNRCDPGSSPDRIGVCRVRVPASATRQGTNRVAFVPVGGGPLRVWYLRLQRAQ